MFCTLKLNKNCTALKYKVKMYSTWSKINSKLFVVIVLILNVHSYINLAKRQPEGGNIDNYTKIPFSCSIITSHHVDILESLMNCVSNMIQ